MCAKFQLCIVPSVLEVSQDVGSPISQESSFVSLEWNKLHHGNRRSDEFCLPANTQTLFSSVSEVFLLDLGEEEKTPPFSLPP